MTKRDTVVLGAPCWIDLMTSDKTKSREFYGRLFGWTSEDAGEEYGHYVNFFASGAQIAGCMENTGFSEMPDVWSVYLATADAQATADAATKHGGQVAVPPMDVMHLGRMAVLLDPSQAAIGVWQPGEHQGFAVVDEDNTPSWFELHTRDYDAAVDFYRSVFGWQTYTVGDDPSFRYTTLDEGDDAKAGIMDASGWLPEGVPSYWTVYFRVPDVDAALAKVKDLGGEVVLPAEDTPYGRLAGATDSTGAMFKLRG
jgi:predicted enzyme related to lactoylglutathione lyase